MQRPKSRNLISRLRRVMGCAALAAVLVGCHGQKKRGAAGGLPPLAASSWLVPVEVPGFGPARVAVPLGAKTPKPLLIALHGDHDRPEWTCGSYRHVVGSRAFILCPEGAARPDRDFTLGPSDDTSTELRKALPALKSRFKAYLSPGPVVLAGLGPSVDQAIELALKEPSFFSLLLLVDGSTKRFTLPAATRFGSAGGKRVLVVCSAGACESDVEQRLRALAPGGVATRIVRVERGHGLDAEVVARLRSEFPWLVSEEPRFR
ncbi:MAG TPA: hypothetical protein VG937_19095 [Polyangiaceae bacterium]|nr:hypothetical protein [Polyangiaceae bacterium]